MARRLTPLTAIVAVFAVQAAAGAGPVLVFPLYLTIILLTALQLTRMEALATAILAATAILIPNLVGSDQPADLAPALLLAVVLMVSAVAITEVVRQGREVAADAERKAQSVAASEERLRTMLEAAMVGLAAVICGSILVGSSSKKAANSSDLAVGKPYVEEDAYDVVSSRG